MLIATPPTLRSLSLAVFLILLAVSSAFAQTTIVVDDDGFGSPANCDDGTAAFATIQGAIDAASASTNIVVCPGVYLENIDFKGKSVSVRSSSGPSSTAIDGRRLGSVVTFKTQETASALLEGFTIQNGFSSSSGGGGVAIQSASPTIRGNVIVGNAACDEGGGIMVAGGASLIEGNTIRDNFQSQCTGGVGGGGIALRSFGTPIIRGNTIINNLFGYGGGLALFAAGLPQIERNIIAGNRALSEGGAIDIVNDSDALIAGNLIFGNTAGTKGGGISWLVPSGARGPLLVNNTIADNDAPSGASLYLDGYQGSAALYSNIITAAANSSPVTCSSFWNPATPIFRSNLVYSIGAPNYVGCADQTGLNGNISGDPLFSSPAGGDYHLRPGSPAIDAGFLPAVGEPAVDIDGGPRVVDGNGDGVAVLDIGADEAVPPVVGMALESPVAGITRSSFTLSGWAVDGRAAGAGIDTVHVWAQPENGSAAVFLGAAQYGLPRPDIGGALRDPRYTNSGFSLTVPTLLRPGTYLVTAYAHSVATNAFAMAKTVEITIRSTPLLSVDVPAPGSSVRSTFQISGWAIDLGSGDGPGIDTVHAYAFPSDGGAPVFLGAAAPSMRRDDVAAAFGSTLFTNSGWTIQATLPAGRYQLAVYALSRVAQAFNQSATQPLTVLGSAPYMAVDAPADGAVLPSAFHVTGWAIDLASETGPGVDAIHVYAFPAGGGAPIFLGAASYGLRRDDVAAAFGGAQFTNSGWGLDAALPPGTYQIGVYARSTIAGTFNDVVLRVATIVTGSR